MPVQCQRVQVNPVNEYASIFEQRARDPALCEENNVIVNPAFLVKFRFDVVGRIDLDMCSIEAHFFPELKEYPAQLVPALFKAFLFILESFRVQGEC